MLNLTTIIDTTTIFKKYVALLTCKVSDLSECIFTKNITKKFSATNSTKSQLHQPPQDNSCSAHQQPKTIEVIINSSDQEFKLRLTNMWCRVYLLIMCSLAMLKWYRILVKKSP